MPIQKSSKIILIGGGGHCHACIDVIEAEGKFQIHGILDLPQEVGASVLGYPVIGTDEDIPKLAEQGFAFLVTVGQIKTPNLRIKIHTVLKSHGAQLAQVTSPLAYVSKHSSVAPGSIVMHHALINTGARVGENCIINTKALIEHDAVIENHCHVSTAAVVNGATRVQEGSFIGSNTVLRECLEIAPCSVVGAGKSIMWAT